jgi:hypothetical protein
MARRKVAGGPVLIVAPIGPPAGGGKAAPKGVGQGGAGRGLGPGAGMGPVPGRGPRAGSGPGAGRGRAAPNKKAR